MAFLSPQAVRSLGFEELGDHVMISDRASIYGAERIALGSHVRIDDFCILSAGEGGIRIGSHVHVAAYSSIIGAGRVTVEDFANISSRVSIYSSSDDYSGVTMTNPMVPDEFKAVDHAPVHVGRHVIIGSGSVVLPGVTLAEGVAVGALSLIREDCEAFAVYAGIPATVRGRRSRELLELEGRLLSTGG
jgi:dTDP-4-amino-4,6-dideoxy-D-glucose acyltransferase